MNHVNIRGISTFNTKEEEFWKGPGKQFTENGSKTASEAVSSPVAELRPHATPPWLVRSSAKGSKGDGQQTYGTKEAHAPQPTTFH